VSTVDDWLREGWLRSVDHAFALSLRRLQPDTADDVLSAAALASQALALGHSLLPLSQAAQLFAEIAPEREPPPLPDPAHWRTVLAASHWVHDAAAPDTQSTPLVLRGDGIALRRYWNYERRLAEALRARAVEAVDSADAAAAEVLLRELFPQLAHTPDDPQAAAARHLLGSRLLLLTGGPGTGKTTTVARALRLQLAIAARDGRAPPRIALSAPTGKAAARLGEALRESLRLTSDGDDAATSQVAQASTLHRLLGWRADSVDFRHDAAHPLPHDIVVVDEASMVDLPLMCKLVEAVAPTARLLLVGDRDQLPSVETGDVLAALCDAADAGGALAPHRFALRRSWRQGDDVDVAQLAAQVRDGDSSGVLGALAQGRHRGVEWLQPRLQPLLALVLARALPAFAPLQEGDDPIAALRQARGFRILTALREGASGSIALNARIAQALQSRSARSERFFHGALLMVTRNSARHGLYNGDIGIVWRAADASLRVWFETDAGARAWLPAALPAHELAFALTVHKSQGSEFDDVLMILPPAGAAGVSRALSRELLYTGITRCRRSLSLWADEEALRIAIARRSQRWSGLAQNLR
jgi:exodeoxyribonuclease V alpha subunit